MIKPVRLLLTHVATVVTVLAVAFALAPAASASSPSSPFRDKTFYVDPDTKAAVLSRLPSTPNRKAVAYIGRRPTAVWVSDFSSGLAQARKVRADAQRKKAYPLYVVYALPHRDNGGYSGGGSTAAEYRKGIAKLARALRGSRGAVILEPDGLAQSNHLTKAQRKQRIRLIRWSVNRLTRNRKLAVYIDMGNSKWRTPGHAASLLRRAGVAKARGFTLNIANFQTTKAETRYGTKISKRLGGKPFLIDTSRNGRGSLPLQMHEFWCNPPGRALGASPTAKTSSPRVDAYVWVKRPGESDGPCKGGGASGSWFHDRAVELVRLRIADLRK